VNFRTPKRRLRDFILDGKMAKEKTNSPMAFWRFKVHQVHPSTPTQDLLRLFMNLCTLLHLYKRKMKKIAMNTIRLAFATLIELDFWFRVYFENPLSTSKYTPLLLQRAIISDNKPQISQITTVF
jgi:hypothetical protein